MPDLWTDLLGCLQLRARDGEPPGGPDVSVFEGANQQLELAPVVRRPTSRAVHTPSGFTGHRTDRWLLLRQHSPLLAHGRCFGRGDVLTEDGSLVASYAQEALLRFRNAGAQVDA